MAGAKSRFGLVLRGALVLALLAAGAFIWNAAQDIQAASRLNLLLRDAFVVNLNDPTATINPDAPPAPVTDPAALAYVFGQPDQVGEDDWQGCADFSLMSADTLAALPQDTPLPAQDIGWQSPVDVALYARSGPLGRFEVVEASIAVLGGDTVLADVIDPATGALTAAVVNRLADAPGQQDTGAYDRLVGKLRFEMVQELGCPGFQIFQIRTR